MAITIDKGIPMPSNKKSELHEALASMNNGDSFIVPENVTTSSVYRIAAELDITVKIIEGRAWKIADGRPPKRVRTAKPVTIFAEPKDDDEEVLTANG